MGPECHVEIRATLSGDTPYRLTESDSLGWPAYVVLLCFGGLACWALVPRSGLPWALGTVVLATAALGFALGRRRTEVQITRGLLVRKAGSGIQTYSLAAVSRASCSWVPYYGTVLRLDWEDGRALEFIVNRSSRAFRSALGDSLRASEPALSGDVLSLRALRRAGIRW